MIYGVSDYDFEKVVKIKYFLESSGVLYIFAKERRFSKLETESFLAKPGRPHRVMCRIVLVVVIGDAHPPTRYAFRLYASEGVLIVTKEVRE